MDGPISYHINFFYVGVLPNKDNHLPFTNIIFKEKVKVNVLGPTNNGYKSVSSYQLRCYLVVAIEDLR